jgi:hypothetical protein
MDTLRPPVAWAGRAATAVHPASARLVERLRTRVNFQFSADVGTIEHEMGTSAQ